MNGSLEQGVSLSFGLFQMQIMLKNALWRDQICWQRGEWD
jgi:hypothetical protein